ncbi:MAG TPA: hypothetical protein VFG19_10480 [Geobacteraceae bacterium]|nr:hypothetical protein [Geobacteraceae bacterium]
MDKDKEKQEISVLGRLFSLEALLVVMGAVSLISGAVRRNFTGLLLGSLILGGLLLFIIIRRRSNRK